MLRHRGHASVVDANAIIELDGIKRTSSRRRYEDISIHSDPCDACGGNSHWALRYTIINSRTSGFRIMTILGIPISMIFQFIVLIPLMLYASLRAISFFLLVPRKFQFKKDLAGQTVLITGAGSGLGRQLAINFSKLSTRLVLLDLNLDSLLDTQKLLQPNTVSFAYICDVSDRFKVYEVADVIKRDVGKVDVLVNNAGIVSGKPFLDIPDEKILKTMEVNSMAHFWTCKAFLPAMIETNKGHIVTIASIAGKGGGSYLSDYCSSKFAAVGFMEALDMELDSLKVTGVKLTTMCPSLMTTGLFEGMKPPFKVTLSPEYVAEQTIYAILEERSTVFLPGFVVIPVIMKLIFPAWVIKIFIRRCDLLYIMDDFKGRQEPIGNGIEKY